MWKDFSIRYIRENRVSSALLAGAAFLASLLLSLLCSIAYNLWADYVKQQQAAAAAARTSPGALFILYAIVLLLVCLALIALLHNAFAVSMGSRMHQLGILKSVGATPGQIRSFLLQEAFALCTLPILAGTGAGIGLCAIFVRRVIAMGREMELNIQYDVAFEYHILVLLISLGTAFLTVLFSAWIPAWRLGRLSPMEAIFSDDEPEIKKVRTFRFISKCFGVYGELAGKSLYSRKKSMRAAGFALFLSFMGFFLFLSGETISGLSTQRTYFDRFRDTWDYMLTVRKPSKENENTDTEDTLLAELRALPDMEACIAYAVVDTTVSVPEQMFSDAVREAGPETLLDDAVREAGPETILGDAVPESNSETFSDGEQQAEKSGQTVWQVKAHFYVLDDRSFQEYCDGENISSDAGAVVVNLLWDDRNSDYMNRVYLPFLKESAGTLLVKMPAGTSDKGEIAGTTKDTGTAGTEAAGRQTGEKDVSLPYDAFTDAIPDIREELEQKALNLVMSETAFARIESFFSVNEMHYNMRAAGTLSKEQSDAMEASIESLVSENLQSGETKSGESESGNLLSENLKMDNPESNIADGSYTLENRLEDERADASAREGLRIVMGVLAGILACVGIAGILSTTLGQLYQRKKEFARYLSLGVSLNEMRAMLFLEALFIVGRPFLLALLIDIPVTALLLNAAPVTAGEFLSHLPWLPVLLLFMVAAVIVAIAYVAAARKICRQNIVEILKDDALI